MYVPYGISYWNRRVWFLLGWCIFDLLNWQCHIDDCILDHMDAVFLQTNILGADVFSGNSHMLIFVKRYNNAALSTNYFWHYFWNWAYLCYKQKQSDREGCLMKTPTIETDRLILREVHKEDTDDIFACWMQDEDVSRYMCWKASDDITKTKEFMSIKANRSF